MNLTFNRIKRKGGFINVHETPQILLGFTELDFPLESLRQELSSYRLRELKQVHSDIIRFSSQIRQDSEGDGIILDESNCGAAIKTADCTPLCFWFPRDSGSMGGGVIHIGWRGLLQGIELKVVDLLEKRFSSFTRRQLNIFLGPSIEKKCYEVGEDLYKAFSTKSYRDKIFSPISSGGVETGPRKYWLDVKQGIRLSLQEAGIPAHQVAASSLCTFCEADRFPSHRRNPNSGRIYNFLILKRPGDTVYLHNKKILR